MARVQLVEQLKPFCALFDEVIVSNHPNEPAKVRTGTVKKGDLVIFEDDVARHVYKGRYFYGKIYLPHEWALKNPKVGDAVDTMSEEDFWGLRKGY